MRTAHGEPMDERRIAPVEIGPEQSILELEAYRPDDAAVEFSDDEETGFHLGPDARFLELAFDPHRRAVQLLHPVGRFDQRLDKRGRVVNRSLTNREMCQRTSAIANPS